MTTYELDKVHVYHCLRCQQDFGAVFPVGAGPLRNVIHEHCGGCGILKRTLPAGETNVIIQQERCT